MAHPRATTLCIVTRAPIGIIPESRTGRRSILQVLFPVFPFGTPNRDNEPRFRNKNSFQKLNLRVPRVMGWKQDQWLALLVPVLLLTYVQLDLMRIYHHRAIQTREEKHALALGTAPGRQYFASCATV